MKIEQIYTACLSQGSYYISSENEAIIIDPLRETQQYIDKANKDKAKIKYVFETHFHASTTSYGKIFTNGVNLFIKSNFNGCFLYANQLH